MVPILPGHLGIFKPGRLRLRLLFGLMDAAYRTRNRPVATRQIWRGPPRGTAIGAT